MLRLVLLVSALQSALLPFQQNRVVYNAPIDSAYTLRAEESHFPKSPGVCCTSLFRLLLVDRANPNRYWEIAAIPEEYEYTYTVKRADRSSLVVERTDSSYGIYEGSFKIFFDVGSKGLLKRIEFKPLEGMKSVSIQEARRAGLDPALFDQIRNFDPNRNLFLNRSQLPQLLRNQSLPQSTYRDFARARPRRVRDGYVENATSIGEEIGAYQVVDGRVWLGKRFYDGEGTTGVGALGYFDIAQQKFVFLDIPEIVDWSVSAILVESQTVWAGLQNNPEGASRSGGLLRHDVKTSSTHIYPIEDLIQTIHRSGNALLIGTSNGIYVFRADHLIRYRAEPTIDGTFVLFTENLSRLVVNAVRVRPGGR